MAHHSSEMDDKIQNYFAQQMAEAAKRMQNEANQLGLGPTGQFPEGQLVDHDEGEIRIAIAAYQNKVVINFGSPVAFIGFTAEQAEEIAETLKRHARDIMNQSAG